MHDRQQAFSLKSLFVPLTTFKAIHIIVVVGFIVFFFSLFNGFVFDDKIYIINNQQIHTFNLSTIFGNSLFNIDGQYRPIASLYFSLMYSVFKDVPFFYHFFSICLHLINSILVFILFSRFFKIHLAFFLSLAFLVHPMQVESATFISTAGNNLYFLFGIIALILSTKEKLSLKRASVITCLLLLSILSKETGILFLFMIFVLRTGYKIKNYLLFSVIGILNIFIYSILRFGIGEVYFAQQLGFIPIANLSFEQRLLNIPAIIFYYISTFLFPNKLAVFQNWVNAKIDYPGFYYPLFLGLVFLLAISLFTAFINKRTRMIYIFFFLWFSIGLLLHVQLFPLNMTVADRWFYFSMVGLLGVIGIALQLLIDKYPHIKYLRITLLSIGVVVLLTLSLRTIIRNIDWRDDLTLYTHDSKVYANFIIENNLGNRYKDIQDYKEAKKHYEKSVEIYPYEGNLFNLAIVNEILNNNELAREYFYKIFSVPGNQREHYNKILANSAWILLQRDSAVNARAFIQKALTIDKDNGYLWAHLAVSEYKLGNQEEAIRAIKRARRHSLTPEVNNLYSLIINKKPIPDNLIIIYK